MPTRCHVCHKLVRRGLEVPVCGDPSTKITVCSKRCRDEYLAGFVETRAGRTVRMLSRPHGPGIVLAVVWAAYAVVHLGGALLVQALPIPLLPAHPGPEFYTGGIAALFVAFAVLREAKYAKNFSAGLAALGFLFAVLSFARTRHLAYALEGATVFPAALLLSLGEAGAKRALAALALFGLYPTALIVTAATGTFARSSAEERIAAEAFAGPMHADARTGLRLTVPASWYILHEDSELLPNGGALFRALRAGDGVAAFVFDRTSCDPRDPVQFTRLIDSLAAGGRRAEIEDARPLPVQSALGEGLGFFGGTAGPPPQLWYIVLLPWTGGRCVEIRCGGPATAERVIRSECIEIGARGVGAASR